MRLLRRLLIHLFPVFWMALAGCAGPPPEPMRLGTNIWPGYEPLYYAREQNMLDGSKVQLKEYTSATEVIRAFVNGTLNAATLTLDEVFLLKQSGVDAKVLLVVDVSLGADAIVARAPITQISDLKGKRIGYEYTALGAYMLSRALSLHGLRPDDVQLAPMPIDQHEQAFDQERVDAVVTFEPVLRRLVGKGARVVFTSNNIPNEIVDVLVVREDYARHNEAVIKHLQDAWFKAAETIQRHPEEAAPFLAKRLRIPPQEVAQQYSKLKLPTRDENRQLLGGSKPQLLVTAAQLQDVMLQLKLLKRRIAVKELILDAPNGQVAHR